MGTTKPQPAKQAILEVLKLEALATVAQIAVSADVGRSTAGKILAQLESDGQVRRTEGGREGNRRLPDLWSLAPSKQPPASDTGSKAASATNRTRSVPSGRPERLKAGGLDPLVLAYLKENADSGPHGATTIAKALERSSGAVGNCLARLAKAKKVREVTDKPRRYGPVA